MKRKMYKSELSTHSSLESSSWSRLKVLVSHNDCIIKKGRATTLGKQTASMNQRKEFLLSLWSIKKCKKGYDTIKAKRTEKSPVKR